MTYRVQTWFWYNHTWIITFFTTVSLVTSNNLGSSICSSKSLYKKTSQEILADLKAGFKGSGDPKQSYPACYDPTVRSVSTADYHRHPPSPPRRREGKNITKRTFRASTIVVQVNKKRLLFFSLKFRVWVFLFLWTPFFKTQYVRPMVQGH